MVKNNKLWGTDVISVTQDPQDPSPKVGAPYFSDLAIPGKGTQKLEFNPDKFYPHF